MAEARKSHTGIPDLPATGIREIDQFSKAIVSLSRSVMESSTQMLRIIDMASVELGGFEYRDGESMRYVVLPQAIKNTLPAIANEFVTIIKESAITYTIGVQDIMSAVNATKGALYIMAEPLIVATVMAVSAASAGTHRLTASRKLSARDRHLRFRFIMILLFSFSPRNAGIGPFRFHWR